MTRAGLVLVALIATCACSRTLDPVHGPPPTSWEGSPGHCDLAPIDACPAAGLPRITERDWSRDEIAQFLQRSRQGTVAVIADGTRTVLVPECALDGRYVEVMGERLDGRFWATNRVLFDQGEAPPGCARATHAVAAFAYRATPPVGFSAILVPLPCPTTDAPAPGCIARGLTLSERRVRAQAIYDDRVMATRVAVPSTLLELYAIAPDRPEWLASVMQLPALPRGAGDCGLGGQIGWLSSHYQLSACTGGKYVLERSPAPRPLPTLDPDRSQDSCDHRPAFLTCFPGLFDPAPDTLGGCWEPAGGATRGQP